MRRGTRVGQAYVAITADGSGINEEIVDSVDAAGKDIEKAGDEHGERYGEHFGDSLKVKFSHAADAAGDELNKRLAASGDDAGKDYGDNFEKSLKRMSKRIGERVGDRVGAAMADRLEESFSGLIDVFEERLAKMSVSGNRGAVSGRDNDVFGDKIGLLLGAGSRNNFLNLFGKSMGNIVNLTTRAATAASGLFTTFSKGFSQATEGASFFQKVFSGFSSVGASGGGIAKMFTSLAASGPLAALAIGVVVLGMSVLVSVASALLGILTALISTIASGLVGALTVLGGALGAVVATAGLLTIAFTSMTDAQQKMLNDAFRPLKAEITGIGQLMLKDMVPAFKVWSRNLQEALALVAPVASVMGKAFAQAGKSLTAALSGPGFARLSQAFTVFLPGIVKRLSSALGGFLNGMSGLFAAILPFVRQFATHLDKVAQKFSAWANSTAGQNSIVDFTQRALESLKSLWAFIKEFVGFIADVLFSREGQQAGNTLFDGLTEAFKGFRRAIKDGSLERWFKDAIKFASDLKDLMKGLGSVISALNNSGVLDAVGNTLSFIGKALEFVFAVVGPIIDAFQWAFPHALDAVLGPLGAVVDGILRLGDAASWALNLLNKIPGVNIPSLGDIMGGGGLGQAGGLLTGLAGLGATVAAGVNSAVDAVVGAATSPNFTIPDLISSGSSALGSTGGGGGGGGGGGAPKFHNPYRKWALSLIKEGPALAALIKKALGLVNKQVAAAIQAAAQGTDATQVRSSLTTMMQNILGSAQSTVSSARSALNSAASSLANATSKASMQRALREVKRAQKDLANALKNQKKIEAAAKLLGKQRTITESNVERLLRGLKVQNATLADFAAARNRLAAQIEKANQKLQEAIQLRDSFRAQVADSIKAFGDLTTAQAQTIDGVEQALTHSDITTNLEARLAKIREFQSNLRILLAQGLSNAAYQQIVSAGVETGSAFATALIEGGVGAVENVNSLVGQINSIADALGVEASNRLYQAGVDAARGLVDGLNSLSAQLNAAAVKLGNAIANAVKNALGIKSPSRVMIEAMESVGDGVEKGLDNQHAKVGRASARFSDQIAVSPEVAAWASRQGNSPTVSGNGDQRPIDLTIITPTEDPMAVAQEAINELTGRL